MNDEVIPTLYQPKPDFQREFLEKRRLEHLQTYPEFTQLEQRLLSMGGEMVVPGGSQIIIRYFPGESYG